MIWPSGRAKLATSPAAVAASPRFGHGTSDGEGGSSRSSLADRPEPSSGCRTVQTHVGSMWAVASAPAAFRVRVWAIMSRGWGPTDGPTAPPERARVGYPPRDETADSIAGSVWQAARDPHRAGARALLPLEGDHHRAVHNQEILRRPSRSWRDGDAGDGDRLRIPNVTGAVPVEVVPSAQPSRASARLAGRVLVPSDTGIMGAGRG